MTTSVVPATRRMNELAAALTRGPVEVLDFFLPLWAGASLGASPVQVGLLTAVETLTSFVVRPIAGVLADRYDRARLAALGGVLYAASFVMYAIAPGLALAYPAALIGGAGGALFWVALRARVGEGLGDDDAAYAKLFSAEGSGTWIAFVGAMTLVARIDYRGVYMLCGAACLAAAVVLVVSGRTARLERQAGHEPGLKEVGRKMRPLLLLVAATATAETAVGLLLLLHLQRGHQLELGEIAAVFLPGFIVYTVLPEYLHRFVVRFGRPRVLSVAMLASAAFAVALSFAPNPYVIAGLWILSATAYAIAIPTEQTVVAEAAGVSLGRGMGIYESATLLGATIGAAGAGFLYQQGGNGWQLACLCAATTLLATAALVHPALRRVGVPTHPAPSLTPPTTKPPTPTKPEPPTTVAPTTTDNKPTHRRTVIRWLQHLALFTIAQAALAALDLSWIRLTLESGIPADLTWWQHLLGINTPDSPGPFYNAGRIWLLIFLADTLYTTTTLLFRRRS